MDAEYHDNVRGSNIAVVSRILVLHARATIAERTSQLGCGWVLIIVEAVVLRENEIVNGLGSKDCSAIQAR